MEGGVKTTTPLDPRLYTGRLYNSVIADAVYHEEVGLFLLAVSRRSTSAI